MTNENEYKGTVVNISDTTPYEMCVTNKKTIEDKEKKEAQIKETEQKVERFKNG